MRVKLATMDAIRQYLESSDGKHFDPRILYQTLLAFNLES